MEKPFLSFGVILLRRGRASVCRLCKWPFLNFPIHSQVLLLFNGKSFVVVGEIEKIHIFNKMICFANVFVIYS